LNSAFHGLIGSLPDFSAAIAIPGLAALIFSEYCSGTRVDFQPPSYVIAASSISNAARFWPNGHSRGSTIRSGIPIHCTTRLKIGAMLPKFNDPPTLARPKESPVNFT
jgi:hypothetical protein